MRNSLEAPRLEEGRAVKTLFKLSKKKLMGRGTPESERQAPVTRGVYIVRG